MKMDSSSLYSLLLEQRRPTFVRQLRLNSNELVVSIVHRAIQNTSTKTMIADTTCAANEIQNLASISPLY
jgi:hypothetical protein